MPFSCIEPSFMGLLSVLTSTCILYTRLKNSIEKMPKLIPIRPRHTQADTIGNQRSPVCCFAKSIISWHSHAIIHLALAGALQQYDDDISCSINLCYLQFCFAGYTVKQSSVDSSLGTFHALLWSSGQGCCLLLNLQGLNFGIECLS